MRSCGGSPATIGIRVDRLSAGGTPLGRLARPTAHPEWIADAFRDALEEPPDGDLVETAAALLHADDRRPTIHLVAWPGGLIATIWSGNLGERLVRGRRMRCDCPVASRAS